MKKDDNFTNAALGYTIGSVFSIISLFLSLSLFKGIQSDAAYNDLISYVP